jgi:hypothetical protein
MAALNVAVLDVDSSASCGRACGVERRLLPDLVLRGSLSTDNLASHARTYDALSFNGRPPNSRMALSGKQICG